MKTAFVGVELIDEVIYVKYAYQIERPTYHTLLEHALAVSASYRRIVVDAAQPGLVGDLAKYHEAFTISFGEENSRMTFNAIHHITYEKVAIHPKFGELIAQLKSVRFNSHGNPDKTRLTFDLGDAFFMALQHTRDAEYYWRKLG